MKRAIVTPAVLPPSALADLKQWLAISTTQDDVPLANLLRASLETCEAFTGTMPLAAVCEETIPAGGDWQPLSTQPVQAITAVSAVSTSGIRTALATTAYLPNLDADGRGSVKVTDPGTATRYVVTFSAGLAATWETLPETLRHGVLRLAAHQHRERDTSGADPVPPASVAALWRPWRRMRLS